MLAAHCVVLGIMQPPGHSCGLSLDRGVVLHSLIAEVSSCQHQPPSIFTAGWHNLLAGTSFLLKYPAHPLLAVVGTKAGDQVHVKGGDPLHNELYDPVLAQPERGLHGLVPHKWLGLAEKVSEWCHGFCLDETVGHLINQPEPASHLTNIGGCWEVPW
jgi:hypothetical protein